MFQYFLAFLIINSHYQSLGLPSPKLLVSDSLTELASQCKNQVLVSAIKAKVMDCAISAPPYDNIEIRCLMFYDINKQLCLAVDESKVVLNSDVKEITLPDIEIQTICDNAKYWAFTNISEYSGYKNVSEIALGDPYSCGEVCAGEHLRRANYFCKYYKWGLDLLKGHVPATTEYQSYKAGAIPEHQSKQDADIPVPVNNERNQTASTKTLNATQTESAPQELPVKTENPIVANQTVQNNDVLKNVPETMPEAKEGLFLPEEQNDQVIKPVNNESDVGNDPAVLPETSKNFPVSTNLKEVVLEKAEAKNVNDVEDYQDSEANDDDDDHLLDVKQNTEAKQNTFSRNQLLPSHNSDISQKDFYPNPMSDTFSDDGDHFFPFFLTAIIVFVVLYVLYHNKSKVSKVFFGMILEGRQSSRRRNSRGHAYRRLDTLEQAMSVNTPAPPSKIIY